MRVRRMIDIAHDSNDDGIMVLMLDWAKASDRVNPASMCAALRRFGLPPEMVKWCDPFMRPISLLFRTTLELHQKDDRALGSHKGVRSPRTVS